MALVNSAIAFALALMAVITVHELAHGVAALTQGLHPVVHPLFEDDNASTVGTKVFIALAGPIFSLVSGVVVLALPQLGAVHGFWRLTILWFGLISVQEFSGYLITGLFTDVGDVGASFALWGTPIWARLLVFLAGWALTYLTGRVATRRLLQLTDESAEVGPQLRDLGLFAWLAGAAISIILSLPTFDFSVAGLFEALATVTVGIFLTFVRLFMRNQDVRREHPTLGWPLVGVLVLAALVLIRTLVFGPGLTL